MTDPADQEDFRRTDSLGVLVGTFTQLRKAILPLIALAIGSSTRDVSGSVILIVALLVIFVLPPLSAFLQWYFRRYRTGADDIRVESGVLSREARSIPYERIQDVSLSETLLSRLFGLMEVRFETGAGGKDDLTLAYVTAEEGARLRELVRERRDDAVEPAPAEDEAAVTEAEPIFAMALPRVILSGVFSFSLVIFAVLFAVADQFDFLLPFDIWDGDVWRAIFSEQGERLRALGRIGQIWGAIVAVFAVVGVGIASGVMKTVLRDYGFRLDRTEKGFRRRRGLLTRTDVVMPRHRVQAVVSGTGPVRRLLGWYSLAFISLASDGAKASHDVAPFARWPEIARIAQEAGIALPPPDLTSPDLAWGRTCPRYWIDRALVWLPPLVIAGAVAIWLAVPVAAVAAGVLLALTAISALTGYLRHYHALDETRIHARAGLLSRHTVTAPRVRLQSAEIVQGPLARWRGYATLHFGLPGGYLLYRGLPLDEARHLRDAVLESVTAVDYAHLPR